MRANPCGTVCSLYTDGQVVERFTDLQCNCGNLLTQYMNEIADATGGKMFNLKDPTDVVNAVKDVITSVTPKRKPELVAGTQPPLGIDLRTVTTPVPVSLAGVYTTAYIYQWS
jgi:hypothetical protein